tara:strand:- start:823 stop:3186 length:2364 start_codon:yes stop_codon:yes gene_type:complete
MTIKRLTACLLSIVALNSYAAVPDGSPYKLLTPTYELNDELNSNLSMPTFILCFMGQLKPNLLLEKTPVTFLAMVNEPKCDSSNKVATTPKNETKAGAASSDAEDSSSNLTPVTVTVSRASSADPMIAKAWIEYSDPEEGDQTIYTITSMTEGVSDTNPYGVFDMYYTGNASGQDVFMGYLKASGSDVTWKDLTYYQDDNGDMQQMNASAIINVGSDDTGNGAISYPKWGDSGLAVHVDTYAYTAEEFCRQNQTIGGSASGASEICYDTDEANGKKEVYGYKLYDSTSGAEFTIENQGFNIKKVVNGVTKFGYADYNGLHFDQATSSALASGDTVTKQSDGSSYTVEIIKSKLRKVEVSKVSLNSIDELRFVARLDNQTPNVSSTNDYKIYYDADNSKFIVTHNFNCGDDGCFFVKITNIEFTLTEYLAAQSEGLWGLSGWLPGVGGIQISRDAMESPTNDLVTSENESEVAIADYPTTLYCLTWCPRYTEIEAAKTEVGNDNSVDRDDVFKSSTKYIHGVDAESDLITYTLNTSTLNYAASDGDLSIGTVSSSLYTKLRSSGIRDGIWSGRLATSKSDFTCTDDWNDYSHCMEPMNTGAVATHYRISSGHERWHQQRKLKDSSGDRVIFNGPLDLFFNAPNDTTKYSEFAGQELRLRYEGGDRLNGIPGRCLNTDTGAFVEDCNKGGGAGYWPWIDLFKIPKNETTGRVYTSSGGTGDYYLVGQTDGAVFLGLKASSIGTLTLGSTSDLPAEAITNVGPGGGDNFIGAIPTRPSKVSMIEGVLVTE